MRDEPFKLRDSDLSKNEQATNNTSKYNMASSSSISSPEESRGNSDLKKEPSFEENWDEDFGTIEDITHKRVIYN